MRAENSLSEHRKIIMRCKQWDNHAFGAKIPHQLDVWTRLQDVVRSLTGRSENLSHVVRFSLKCGVLVEKALMILPSLLVALLCVPIEKNWDIQSERTELLTEWQWTDTNTLTVPSNVKKSNEKEKQTSVQYKDRNKIYVYLSSGVYV